MQHKNTRSGPTRKVTANRAISPLTLIVAAAPFFISPAQAAPEGRIPAWHGCYVQNYEREFERRDGTPFEKPYIDWTPADYADLRRRITNCMDSYFAVPGRREFYLSNVDARLAAFREAQDRLIARAQEQTNPEQKPPGAQERQTQAEVAASRKAEIMRQRLDQLHSLKEEFDSLPAEPSSVARLNEMQNVVQNIGSVKSMVEFLREADFSQDQQRAFNIAQSELLKEVIDKRQTAIKAGLDYDRSKFRSNATRLADAQRDKIEALAIPTSYLDATIYIESLTSTDPFATLRQIIAILFNKNVGNLSAVEYQTGTIGLVIKVPGRPSVIYGFRPDGGDLFFSSYEQGDAHELLINPWEKVLVETQLVEAVGWPTSWSGEIPPSPPQRSGENKPEATSQGRPSQQVFGKMPDPRFSPRGIARALDNAESH